MKFNCKDDILQLSPEWTGERFDDGRPRVPDGILRRLKNVTFEEAWGTLWHLGYRYQNECSLKAAHPTRKLIGRAVTTVYVPMRPDLHDYLLKYGHENENRKGFFNQWVIDKMEENDVVVVDLYDKLFQGTYVGGNLSTAIASRTKNGGAVIWGGIRDLEQIVDIENIQIYYRGVDPTGIGDCTMTGYNVPCRIGNAVCMPGDVVLGTISGVLFIPPQRAEEVAVNAEKSHIRDTFGFTRLDEKIYTTAQIDTAWTTAMFDDFINWFKTDPKAGEYQHLTWDSEIESAAKVSENNSQVII